MAFLFFIQILIKKKYRLTLSNTFFMAGCIWNSLITLCNASHTRQWLYLWSYGRQMGRVATQSDIEYKQSQWLAVQEAINAFVITWEMYWESGQQSEIDF